MMKKGVVFYSAFSVIVLCADYVKERDQEQEFVILRNAQVLSKARADSININLSYLQYYRDGEYDALCLALVIGLNRITSAQNVSVLQDLHLIDDHQRIEDDVAMVLDARLLDSNIRNPTPYQMPVSVSDQAGSASVDTFIAR